MEQRKHTTGLKLFSRFDLCAFYIACQFHPKHLLTTMLVCFVYFILDISEITKEIPV